jgi:nitrite reductase/ring-hydroxylating ferredoxin subunit
MNESDTNEALAPLSSIALDSSLVASTNSATNSEPNSVTETVGSLADLDVGSMKMVRVGGTPVALIRTEAGVHAIDNACPHQGYGLVTGDLADGVVTCQWHNWKFDAATGTCLVGEEDVACHRVEVADGEVAVTVTKPSAEERRATLWPSLRRGLERNYVGQMARDSARLLESGSTPAQIMAEALRVAAPKADDGVGHEMAMAADALAIAEVRTGDDAFLALVQGLSGLSEETRDYPPNPVPGGDPTIDIEAAVEAEDVGAAMSGLIGRIERGDEPSAVRATIINAVSAHHRGYGHGIIYTQKSFELLDRIGWDLAPDLLPHLLNRITHHTREDTLPYMRKAMRELTSIDLEALAAEAESWSDRPDPDWDPGRFADRLLTADQAPIVAAADLMRTGVGVEGVLDAATLAVSERLLRHDLDVEFDNNQLFGWLDITHGLTTARAARWAWRNHPSPAAIRSALFAVWLAYDTGRSERRHDRAAARAPLDHWVDENIGATTGGTAIETIDDAVVWRRPEEAVALALTADRSAVAEQLRDASLADRAGSFIVMAHLVKTSQAAIEEANVLDSPVPLAAAARFLAAPRLERFVARASAESADFIRTGSPPKR